MAFKLVALPLSPHPVVFLVLILPFGVMAGYLTAAVVYLLTQAGVPVDESAALVAISYIFHSWKSIWALGSPSTQVFSWPPAQETAER